MSNRAAINPHLYSHLCKKGGQIPTFPFIHSFQFIHSLSDNVTVHFLWTQFKQDNIGSTCTLEQGGNNPHLFFHSQGKAAKIPTCPFIYVKQGGYKSPPVFSFMQERGPDPHFPLHSFFTSLCTCFLILITVFGTRKEIILAKHLIEVSKNQILFYKGIFD